MESFDQRSEVIDVERCGGIPFPVWTDISGIGYAG